MKLVVMSKCATQVVCTQSDAPYKGLCLKPEWCGGGCGRAEGLEQGLWRQRDLGLQEKLLERP